MMQDSQAAAYVLEGGGLVQRALHFPFLEELGHIVSLVGGGGKTTLMMFLAGCYARRGLRTAVMTTTKIGCPPDYCAQMAACRARWAEGKAAVCGTRLDNGKLDAPDPAFLGQLLEEAEAVLIEADGARRLPCKAPAAHEPVILPQSDIVIAVMGLDALGRPVEETCLRPEKVQEILGCDARHALTCEDMVRLLLSEQGSRKGVEQRTYYTVLNKCDGPQQMESGRRILTLLAQQGHRHAMLTAFGPDAAHRSCPPAG